VRLVRPDRSGFRWVGSHYAYEVLWRLLACVFYPISWIAIGLTYVAEGIWRAARWVRR
jgi:hypothetical protein